MVEEREEEGRDLDESIDSRSHVDDDCNIRVAIIFAVYVWVAVNTNAFGEMLKQEIVSSVMTIRDNVWKLV